MKDVMIDIMVAMMPLMKPFMWLGILVAILGFMMVGAKLAFNKHNANAIVWSERVVFFIAIFFLAAQIAGHFLSMPPTINFGDISKFEFILVSFWQIGVAFLVSALIIKFVGSSNKVQHS
ncbi:MAG: hypothetical protein ACN4GM_11740 [Gammaproteobacteria bacterium]